MIISPQVVVTTGSFTLTLDSKFGLNYGVPSAVAAPNLRKIRSSSLPTELTNGLRLRVVTSLIEVEEGVLDHLMCLDGVRCLAPETSVR